jgi:hypothetical protein
MKIKTIQIEYDDPKNSHENFLGGIDFYSFQIEFLITNCYSKFDKHGEYGYHGKV